MRRQRLLNDPSAVLFKLQRAMCLYCCTEVV
jgi:hypothetical protein